MISRAHRRLVLSLALGLVSCQGAAERRAHRVATASFDFEGLDDVRVGGASQPASATFYDAEGEEVPDVRWSLVVTSGGSAARSIGHRIQCDSSGRYEIGVRLDNIEGSFDLTKKSYECRLRVPRELRRVYRSCTLPADWNDLTVAQREAYVRDERKRNQRTQVVLWGAVENYETGWGGRILSLKSTFESDEGDVKVFVPRSLHERALEFTRGADVVVVGRFTPKACTIGVGFMGGQLEERRVRADALYELREYLELPMPEDSTAEESADT